MGSTNRDQVIRFALLALTAASVCRAQQPAPSVEGASAQPTPAAVVKLPADAPIMPPKVVCAGDQMTISANNSTLSSVLAEVRRCMGTQIDLPTGAGEKRMFDHIGPGPVSQVLDELLSNTGYNYVIGAASDNQDKIASIMLLARSADAGAIPTVEDSRAGSTSRRAFMQMHQASIPHPMTEADTAAAAEVTAPDNVPAPAETPAAATQPATPPPATPAEGQTPAADASQKPADAAPAQPEPPPVQPPSSTSGRPATTEDQITNMQQMFELRKQLNQPAPSQNSNTPQP
jgi:hypothetical protein